MLRGQVLEVTDNAGGAIVPHQAAPQLEHGLRLLLVRLGEMAQDTEVLGRVVEIDDLDDPPETVFHHEPDPFGTVRRKDNRVGLVVPSDDGLVEKLPGERRDVGERHDARGGPGDALHLAFTVCLLPEDDAALDLSFLGISVLPGDADEVLLAHGDAGHVRLDVEDAARMVFPSAFRRPGRRLFRAQVDQPLHAASRHGQPGHPGERGPGQVVGRRLRPGPARQSGGGGRAATDQPHGLVQRKGALAVPVHDIGAGDLDRADRREDRPRPGTVAAFRMVHAEHARKDFRVELAQDARRVAQRRGL